MRRSLLPIFVVFGILAYALGQTKSSDTQTLQALLREVRALRQDLQVSMNRSQTMQILLARFQMQEGAITRASDRLNDARQKVLDSDIHQKELEIEVKKLEDTLSGTENRSEQTDLQGKIDRMKSELELAENTAQQQQATQTQAEQGLREEQDKLKAIESQLDEVIRAAAEVEEKSADK